MVQLSTDRKLEVTQGIMKAKSNKQSELGPILSLTPPFPFIHPGTRQHNSPAQGDKTENFCARGSLYW